MSVTNEELKATLAAQAESLRRVQDTLDALPDRLDAKLDKYLTKEVADQRFALVDTRINSVVSDQADARTSRRAGWTLVISVAGVLAVVMGSFAAIIR